MIENTFELTNDSNTYESNRKYLKVGFLSALIMNLSLAIGQGLFSLQYGVGHAGIILSTLSFITCFSFIAYGASRMCWIASQLE